METVVEVGSPECIEDVDQDDVGDYHGQADGQ